MYIYICIYTTFLPIHIPKTYLMSAPKSSESEANNWGFPWTWNDAVKLSHEWSWVSLTMSFDGFPPERIWRMGWMIWQSVFLVATNEKWKEDLCINKCSSKMNTWSYVYIYIDANHLATGSKYPSLPWWSFSGRLEAEKVLLHHLL